MICRVATILDTIVERKREEIVAARAACPAVELEARLADAPAPRGFVQAIRQSTGVALIARIAPPELRGRVTSLLLLDRALAQLLALPIAAIAQGVGLTTLFPILGAICVVTVVVLLLAAGPAVWRRPLAERPNDGRRAGIG